MPPSDQSLRGCKILIVDDDRLNVRVLQSILAPEGFTLADAGTGESALERYAEFQPDLVLLDVELPGINGFDTCRELRRRYGEEETAPVVFITARAESDDVVEGLTAGGVDYLPKPVRAKEALARIHTHLHSRILMEQLSRANAAKNRFLGMAAHDLRTPLASIRGLAEFLQDPALGPLNPGQRDLVETIHDTSRSMLHLVNELLDVATIEAGELRLQPSPCDLGKLVEKSVYLANIDAARKDTRILVEPAAATALTLDEARMKQVVDNLLSNAVKYSPPGSTIAVRFARQDGTCSFSVIDQGPGIPDRERHKLFKDFGRLSVQPTGGEKATGLGLAICRKIVEAHHGVITAENLPARGCEFRVTLPLLA